MVSSRCHMLGSSSFVSKEGQIRGSPSQPLQMQQGLFKLDFSEGQTGNGRLWKIASRETHCFILKHLGWPSWVLQSPRLWESHIRWQVESRSSVTQWCARDRLSSGPSNASFTVKKHLFFLSSFSSTASASKSLLEGGWGRVTIRVSKAMKHVYCVYCNSTISFP